MLKRPPMPVSVLSRRPPATSPGNTVKWSGGANPSTGRYTHCKAGLSIRKAHNRATGKTYYGKLAATHGGPRPAGVSSPPLASCHIRTFLFFLRPRRDIAVHRTRTTQRPQSLRPLLSTAPLDDPPTHPSSCIVVPSSVTFAARPMDSDPSPRPEVVPAGVFQALVPEAGVSTRPCASPSVSRGASIPDDVKAACATSELRSAMTPLRPTYHEPCWPRKTPAKSLKVISNSRTLTLQSCGRPALSSTKTRGGSGLAKSDPCR